MPLASSFVRLAAAVALCAASFAAAPLPGRHAAAESGAALPEPFDPAAMDPSADACRDFFTFATGAYRAAHPIPPQYSEYGYIEALEDRTRDIIRSVVLDAQRNPGPAGGNARKIGTLYATCMDTGSIERNGLRPLEPEFARIAAIGSRADLSAAFARLQLIGVDAAFALNPVPDVYDSSKILAELDQGGIGLPERDYYLRTDAESRKLRAAYVAHVGTMLELSGDADAHADARAVVALETQFARASTPVADLRDPLATYHPLPARSAFALAPHAGLPQYLALMNVRAATINVGEPGFVRALDRSIATTPLTAWRAYLRWRLLDAFAPALPARFEEENFAFRDRMLFGAQAPLPRWKRCVNATGALLGEAVGEAYVARTFPPPAKARALDMTERIKRAYLAEMRGLTWMTPATKRTAIGKLEAMGLKVGYPAVWRSYANYTVGTDSYAANTLRGREFERRYELAMIGRPVDRNQWGMTPQTVDAYNDTQRNEIVLPAAQLQRPFFDPAVDDAANLAATGAGTIGHEMTHGFDDEGHKFDAHGNLRNWWTPHDLAQFTSRAACVIHQFDATPAVGSLHYQGRLVSGEAIADLGGVVIGYRALESSPRANRSTLDGFTPEQRYFLAFAQSWTESVRPETARTQALTDPHPLPRDRVNQTLLNVPGWYTAFNCPKPRRPICEIW